MAQRSRLRDVILPTGAREGDSVVDRALQAVRAHLGLEIAYVSEFVGNDSVFRHVDAPGLEALIKPGDSRSLDDVYCRHILAGRIPELLPDTTAHPVAAAMPVTAAVPIGAHMSVPVRLSDGEVYGMFCCLSPTPDPSLNPRDLDMMRAFAELAAFEIERDRNASQAQRDSVARVQDVIDSDSIGIVYQPIWSLDNTKPIGFECLARFGIEPVRTPDLWFAEAAEAGLGVELELAAIRAALRPLPALPGDAYLAINASPETAMGSGLAECLAGKPLDRIVLEITEHQRVDDFAVLAKAVAPLRARGLRLAVDDAGAGYSGLQQILQLRPDLIKLDRSLIEDIANDPGRRALAAALTLFARETGSRLIAEGVETEAELAILRALGLDIVQGYLLGRPGPIEQVYALLGESVVRRIGKTAR